jgi:hypothetical protein
MMKPEAQEFIEMAERIFDGELQVRIDRDPLIVDLEEGEDGRIEGAWVGAWIWVGTEEL